MSVDPSRVNPLYCDAVTPECPVKASIYGYYPILGWNAFFAAIFGVCSIVNVGLALRYKTWTYGLAMTTACLASGIGYIGRCLMHDNPFDVLGFRIQITCLTFSAALNCAALYLTLKHVVLQFGPELSRVNPKLYTWGFILADTAALSLQATGGGIAGSAGDDAAFREIGDRLMISGISWQVLTLLLFGTAVADFVIRRWRSAQSLSAEAQQLLSAGKFRAFVVASHLAYTLILIRCVYRIAEMAGGWRNPIMQDEALFIGLDSFMVGIATALQTFVHPGFCFPAMATPLRKRPSARPSAAAGNGVYMSETVNGVETKQGDSTRV